MLDINAVRPLSEIEPVPGLFRPVPPLQSIKTLSLDIETSGLDPEVCRIYMVGLRTNSDTVKIITHSDERIILIKIAMLLETIGKVIIYGHNIFKFDLPFILRRCELLNVNILLHTRKLYNGQEMERVMKLGGFPIYYKEIQAHNIDFVDTLFLTRMNDAKYLFSDHSLKTVAIEIGSRATRRLELSHTEIDQRWNEGPAGRAVLEEYLQYDLEDTKAVFYKFFPAYYHMSSFLSMSLQEIVLSSSAKKIESIIVNYYKSKGDYVEPESSPKIKYTGALTLARPGLYKNVTKIDVASQYPWVMLMYRVGTSKDPDGIFFRILRELRDLRLVYKKKDENISDALKIVINSAYGMLGSDRPYNDPKSAELVCAYGRAIVIKMMQSIEAAGGLILELDTDGIIFSGDADKIISYVKTEMPPGLEMDIEYVADWIYIDAAKNYIYKVGPKLIRKGIFRKRNQMKLMVEFVETYCIKYLENPASAEEYYNKILNNTKEGMDIKLLAITRKISKAEKVCLKYGAPGDRITVYRGYDEGRKPVPVISGPYHVEFYLKELNKWKQGIDESILTKQELTGKNVEYLNTLQKDGTYEYPY